MKLTLKKFAILAFVGAFFLGLVGCTTTTTLAEMTDTEKVQAVLDGISLGDISAVTENLTLPAPTTNGVAVTWSSADTNFISNSGEVTIPSFTAGDQEVILTATAILNTVTLTKTFTVTVTKEAAATYLARAAAAIIIDGSDQVTANFQLPATALGATVTWVSSNPTMASIATTAVDGFYLVTIARPQVDDGGVNTTVTLTATITSGTNELESVKSIRVIAEESSVKVATIAEGMALGTHVYVTYEGVTIIGIGTDGIFFTDGATILFAYGASLTTSVVKGDVYDITGELAYYYYGPQLADAAANIVKVEESSAAVSTFTPIVATVTSALANHPTPSETNKMVYTIYELTAKVYYDEELGDYGTYLVPADYDVSVPLDLEVTDAIRVYYKSNMNAISALAGEVITFDLLLYAYHSTYGDWYSYFNGVSSDIQVSFADDQDAVNAALASIEFPATVMDDTTLNLPASLFGVSLSYVSDTPLVINATTGAIDALNQTTQVTVTITVTATKGSITNTQDFIVKVGEVPLMTIAEATDLANVGSLIRTNGIITQINGNNAWIEDATGALYVYLGAIATYASSIVVGNEIQVQGTLYNYHNLLEVSPVTNITLLQTAQTVPAPLEVVGADLTTLLANISKLANVSGLVVKSIPTVGTYSYTIYLTDGTDDLQLRVDSYGPNFAAINAVVAGLVVGQKVSLNGIVVSVYNSAPQLMWYEVAELTSEAITDVDKVDYDKMALPATLELDEDYTLPVPLYAALTVKEISTELTAYLADGTTKLTVTIPETADAVGTVTFTYTLNSVIVDVVVNVTVKAMTEADKLALALEEIPTDIYIRDAYTPSALLYDGVYTTITISAELTSNLTEAAGVLTSNARPAAGEANVVGTVSYLVTIGSASQTVVVNATVMAYAADLFFSEYIESDGGNDKAFEIFNGTGADVDLSTYTVELYTNGAITPAYNVTLSGTLLAGDVYVIYNSGAGAAILAAGDLSSSLTYYNGDDALLLKHSTVVIDCIGRIGTVALEADPGSEWIANGVSTSNMTLLRIASVNTGDSDPYDTFDPSATWYSLGANVFTEIGSYTSE
ncbi:MAG: lamin tail domain-containing protein [Firmicutes bacterium]|nr:lamin tail domain-containing protein [Bacillota bacterium]